MLSIWTPVYPLDVSVGEQFLSFFAQCSFNFYLRKLEVALSSIQLFYSTYPHAASTAEVLVKYMGKSTDLESFPLDGCVSAHSSVQAAAPSCDGAALCRMASAQHPGMWGCKNSVYEMFSKMVSTQHWEDAHTSSHDGLGKAELFLSVESQPYWRSAGMIRWF